MDTVGTGNCAAPFPSSRRTSKAHNDGFMIEAAAMQMVEVGRSGRDAARSYRTRWSTF
jgi:hypothetical protein